MIQCGTGKVDFKGVFEVLKRGGVDGAIMVECCAIGDTPHATAANAQVVDVTGDQWFWLVSPGRDTLSGNLGTAESSHYRTRRNGDSQPLFLR